MLSLLSHQGSSFRFRWRSGKLRHVEAADDDEVRIQLLRNFDRGRARGLETFRQTQVVIREGAIIARERQKSHRCQPFVQSVGERVPDPVQ